MKAIFLSVRSNSSRLPKKALLKIKDKCTIEYLIDNLKKTKLADAIILCTSEEKDDDILCEIAKQNEILYFRGSLEDKLLRWKGACEKYNIDFFVNADGDDIFFDAQLADICFEQYNKDKTIDFIDGQGLYNDIYGIKYSALKTVCQLKESNNTEFIKPFFDKKYNLICNKIANVPKKFKKHKIRMTLDYQEDFDFFSKIINYFNENNLELNLENILLFLKNNKEIININWHCERKWKNNQKKMFLREKQ